MIKNVIRPNGNLTLYEYDSKGRVVNKIIQKESKDIVSCFDNQGKFITAIVYDNKDTVIIHNKKGELIAETGKNITRLRPDIKESYFDRILNNSNNKYRKGFKSVTKGDGLRYWRSIKPFTFLPEKHFSHRLLNFVINLRTLEIRSIYTKLLAGRKVF